MGRLMGVALMYIVVGDLGGNEELVLVAVKWW
jgi:hypothetical protein